MSMYVIRVKPGMDCEVAASLRKRGYFIRCPQRTLSIRKDGTWTDRTEPIFSGYLFLESPESGRWCAVFFKAGQPTSFSVQPGRSIYSLTLEQGLPDFCLSCLCDRKRRLYDSFRHAAAI